MKYIDADKLIVEIERRKKELLGQAAELGTLESNRVGLYDDVELYDDLLASITSLQQEQPEVDIEKEITEHAINTPHCEFSHDSEDREHEEWAIKEFRHFYELGLNARKEESK